MGFLLVAVTVVTGIHLYLWQRLVRDTLVRGPWRRAAGFGMLALGLLVPATLIGSRLLPHGWRAQLAWPGYLWLALMFYLLVGFAALELPRLALRAWSRSRPAAPDVMSASLVGAPPGSTPSTESPSTASPSAASLSTASLSTVGPSADRSAPDGETAGSPPVRPAPDPRFNPSRRLLIGRGAAAIAGLGALAATGVGVSNAFGPPEVRRVAVRLSKLPASMEGFRIALVSDIHLGPLLGRSHTERIVRLINGVDADIVAIVGDLVDGSVAELGESAEPLQDLRARRGSFFVTGNHEYYSGYEEWIDEIDSLGVKVLRNQRVDIDGLDLAGVNDVTGDGVGDGPDYRATFAGRDARRPVVMLSHQPIQVHEAAKHGVDLQLSGHTHGGQMVPFNYIVAMEQPVVAGLATIDGTQLYVTRGAGFWGPPVRLGAPPEISVIELHRP